MLNGGTSGRWGVPVGHKGVRLSGNPTGLLPIDTSAVKLGAYKPSRLPNGRAAVHVAQRRTVSLSNVFFFVQSYKRLTRSPFPFHQDACSVNTVRLLHSKKRFKPFLEVTHLNIV